MSKRPVHKPSNTPKPMVGMGYGGMPARIAKHLAKGKDVEPSKKTSTPETMVGMGFGGMPSKLAKHLAKAAQGKKDADQAKKK